MANISKITLPDGNTYDIKDANAYQKPSDGIPASDLASGVIPSTPSAADVTYDNTQSGLTANDVQEAIDELAAGGSTSGKADQATIASVEASTTATEAHALGSIFYLNGVLYRALADIAIGGTINTGSGGNATQTTVAENFSRIVKLTSAQYAQLSAAEKAADIVYIVTDEPVPAISTTTPNMDGTAAAGSTGEVSDAGHTHPTDTSRVPVYGMGENLLRNAYFLNPVNQRGITTVTQRNVYTIDGWKTRDASYPGSVALTQNGIVITSSNNTSEWIEQRISDPGLAGKSVTLSVLASDGLFTNSVASFPSTGTAISVTTANGTAVCEWSGGTVLVSLRANVTKTVTYVAAKLELGSQQTLAHLEGSTWVLNEIPDYEQELISCQTSTADSDDPYANKVISVNIPNKNLLRNWYFVGGGTPGKFPINQRGLTTYTAAGYCIDGWTCGSSTYGSREIVSGGIKVTGLTNWHQVYQYLDSVTSTMLYPGSTVTLSALTADGELLTASDKITTSGFSANNDNGVIYCIYENAVSRVRVQLRAYSGKTIIFQAAKLELGTQQTLCHNEGTNANPVWVLNEVPDYEKELIKCQTSTADSADTYANKSLATEQELAPTENGLTASQAYAVGAYFCRNGETCRAKTAIQSGATLTENTNYTVPSGGLANRIRIATASLTTNASGQVSTGLNVSSGHILAAFASGYEISVYCNSSGVQGYFVKTAGTNTPAASVTISVTAVILNY